MNKRGKFIVFEGLDGSGKSTLLELCRVRLGEQLRHGGSRRVFATREPSDNLPGLLCRSIGKGLMRMRPETEALLYAADRAEHIEAEILPMLEAGSHVLCDRYYFSNFAYQSNVSSLESLIAYNRRAMERCRADATVFIDVPPDECARRRSLDRATEEIYESPERARITYEQYHKAFALLGAEENIIVIDGLDEPRAVFRRVWDALCERVFTEEDFR